MLVGDNESQVAQPNINTRILIALAICAACVKLILAFNTHGTNDIDSFRRFNQMAASVGALRLYGAEPLFNHPPFVIDLLSFLAYLENATGVSFGFWLRFLQTAADAGSLYLIYRISRFAFGERLRFAPLWLVAIAPASIFISGFHGNNDPLMIFFILLAVYFASVTKHQWLAGAAFGMSCNIKIWPLMLVPIFFFYLEQWNHKVKFFAAATVVAALWWFPYLGLDGSSIVIERVFGYRSSSGYWGITRLLGLAPSWSSSSSDYVDYGRYLIAFAIAAVAFAMNHVKPRPRLFEQCGVGAFLFMALTPGFGVQYLAWLIPWVAWTSLRYSAAFHIATGTFLFLIYTFWSGGLPWDKATAGAWRGSAVVFELASWALVVAYVVIAGYRFCRRQPPEAGETTLPVKRVPKGSIAVRGAG